MEERCLRGDGLRFVVWKGGCAGGVVLEKVVWERVCATP